MKRKLRKDELTPGMILGETIENPWGDLHLSYGTILNDKIIPALKDFPGEYVTILLDPSITQLIKATGSAQGTNLIRMVVPAGNYLYLQGESEQKVFLLVKGQLQLIYVDPDELSSFPEGKEKLATIIKKGRRVSSITKPNAIFGELAPLLALPRMTSALAMEHTIVSVIPAGTAELQQTILNHPNFGLSMAVGLANQVNDRIQTIKICKSLIETIEPLLLDFPKAYVNITNEIKKRCVYSPGEALKLAQEKMETSQVCSKVHAFQRDSSALKNYHPILGRSSRSINYDIFNDSEMIEVPEGAIICAPGDPSNLIYILRSGALGVLRDQDSVITYRRKGDALGTVSALLGSTSKNQSFDVRSFTIKALSPTRYIQIKADDFQTLGTRNPELILHISRGLADRVRNTNAELLAYLTKMELYFQRLHEGDETILSEIKSVLNICHSDKITRELCIQEITVLENMQVILEQIATSVQKILLSAHPGATFQPT